MTKLADAKKVAPTPKVTAMAAAFGGAPHAEDITITIADRTVVAKMTLVGTAAMLDIEGDVLKAMAERGLEQGVLTQGEYELERYCRALAVAVCDPTNLDEPFGSVEDWGSLAPEAVTDAWRQYSDMRERCDPVAVPLSATDREALQDAIVKKNETYLRSFGVRRLASYLLTTVVPPVSSPTPTSSDGDTSSES